MNPRTVTGWLRRSASAVLLLTTLVAAQPALAQQLAPIPALTSPVTDTTGTLTPDQTAALDAKLRAFAQAKGSQVAVLIVPTTQPEDIDQYSIRVVEQWKLGRARVDDGVLLLVALNDRKVRIEVGYGLEGALPDATANRIIDEDLRPQFRRGDIYGGIETAVDRIMRVIEGEALPAPELSPPSQNIPGLFNLLPFLLVFAFVGGTILRAIFGRLLGSVATGGLVGFLTWMLIGILGLSLAAGIVAFVFSVLGGSGGGSGGGGWSSRRHGSGWGYPGGFGGGGGGGFRGGGGFGGGFGGGGGGFGGGGASGGW